MATQWCTRCEKVLETCFQGNPSNLKVIWSKLANLNPISVFSDDRCSFNSQIAINDAESLIGHRGGAVLIGKVIRPILKSHGPKHHESDSVFPRYRTITPVSIQSLWFNETQGFEGHRRSIILGFEVQLQGHTSQTKSISHSCQIPQTCLVFDSMESKTLVYILESEMNSQYFTDGRL